MRVLGAAGLHARRRFRRSLPLPSACGAVAAAAFAWDHPVVASVSGALSITLLRRALAWHRGAEGEARVCRVLEEADLPGWVVNNVILWRLQGDLDHVVLLPWGVFVLETKSGRPLPGHFRQAGRKAAALRTFLERRGLRPQIAPVLVLAARPSGGGPPPRAGAAGLPPVVFLPDLVPFLLGNLRAGTALSPQALERVAHSLHGRSGGTL